MAVATPGEVPKTRRQRELVTAGGTHIVFYEKDLEDFYLQSIPVVVVANNKVNHYTATKVISQEEFQSWKVQQSCILAQSFIKTASIVNKEYVSQDVSEKLEVCVDSMKHLLTLFAMDWTESTVGDQSIWPIFHVPHSSSKSDFCLVLLQLKNNN